MHSSPSTAVAVADKCCIASVSTNLMLWGWTAVPGSNTVWSVLNSPERGFLNLLLLQPLHDFRCQTAITLLEWAFSSPPPPRVSRCSVTATVTDPLHCPHRATTQSSLRSPARSYCEPARATKKRPCDDLLRAPRMQLLSAKLLTNSRTYCCRSRSFEFVFRAPCRYVRRGKSAREPNKNCY